MQEKYTHYAIDTTDNKIINGWDYTGLTNREAVEWAKIDFKDNGYPKTIKFWTWRQLVKLGIDPISDKSWKNLK